MALDPTRRAAAPHSTGTPAFNVSVLWLQRQLNVSRRARGAGAIAEDGVLGPETTAATAAFFAQRGVSPRAGTTYYVDSRGGVYDGTPDGAGRVRMTAPFETLVAQDGIGRAVGTIGRTAIAVGGGVFAVAAYFLFRKKPKGRRR